MAAAAFLAVAPFAVRDAHYVKHDVPATLAALLAMLAIVSVWRGASEDAPSMTRTLVVAGLSLGLAASVHYYLVFLGVPLAIAVWSRTSSATAPVRARSAGLTAAAAAIGFFAGSPFLLVEPATALRDVAANRRIVMDRAVDASGGLFPSAGAYARMLSLEALGWPVALLAAIGLLVLARRAPRLALLLAAFPVAFLVFISNTVAATRYLNPVLPFLCIFAAAGAVWIGKLVAASRPSSGGRQRC